MTYNFGENYSEKELKLLYNNLFDLLEKFSCPHGHDCEKCDYRNICTDTVQNMIHLRIFLNEEIFCLEKYEI